MIRAGIQKHAALARRRQATPFSPDGFIDEYHAMAMPKRGRVFGRKNRQLRRALDELATEVVDRDTEGTMLQGLGDGDAALNAFRDPATVRWIKNVARAKSEGKPLMVKYYAKRMPIRADHDEELAATLTQFVES